MTKRIIRIVILAICMAWTFSFCCFAEQENNSPEVIINSNPIEFADAKPFISNNTALVPMRDIFNALGANVFWYDKTNSITAIKGSDMIELQIGNKTAAKNNKTVLLSEPAVLINSQTFVPLRFVAEAFSADVSYDSSSNRIIITDGIQSTEDEKTPEEKFSLLPDGEKILSMENIKPSAINLNEVDFSLSSGAARIDIKKSFENPYNCQLNFALKDFEFKKDDIMLCSLKVRALEAENGSARIGLVHEQNSGSYSKTVSCEYSIAADGGWNTIYLPYRLTMDFKKGCSQFNIRLGYLKQCVEIKDFSLVRYQNISFSALPASASSYEGRDENSEWQKDIAKQIEQNRKTNMTVLLTDQYQAPVSGAEVKVEMINHEFSFGTAVKADYINSSDSKYDSYKKYLSLFFNSAVLENALKLPNWNENPQRALTALDNLNKMGFKNIRGHTMVWDRLDKLPAEFSILKESDPRQMEDKILLHIQNIGSAAAGKLNEWDVANEVLQNHYMRDVLGDETLVKWFKAAKAADPNASLYINENTVTSIKSPNAEKFYNFVKKMKQLGAPIDGIGLQCHFNTPVDMDDFCELLKYYSTLGCDIKITEFDFVCSDKKLQADFTKDIILACYACPNVKGFTMWGFGDFAHHANDAPLFYKDYTLKPSGGAYIKTVYDTLWTSESGKTDESGRYSLDTFYGDYQITVKKNGKTYTSYQSLKKGENNVFKITLIDN